MSNKYQMISNSHLTTKNSEQIYNEIENDREDIKRSINHLRNSFCSIKASSLDTIQNPVSALTRNINLSGIMAKRPFKTLLIAAGMGFIATKIMGRTRPSYSRVSNQSLSNNIYTTPSITDEIINKLKNELAYTVSIVVEETFYNIRKKMQDYNSKE